MTKTKTTSKALVVLNEAVKEGGIAGVVAQDALDNGTPSDALAYLQDVTNHGCVSGTCTRLIYYTDTYAFYTEHADEIDTILEDIESNTGEAFKLDGQNTRNTLAWLGYEETARKLLDACEVDN